jgi:hypothetical protein
MEELIHEVGPNGNVQAHAEDDGRVVYLYLRGVGDNGLPTCPVWIQNRIPAPQELDVSDMERGNPPLMPARFCRHPAGTPMLAKDQLRLVWLPEGDGVALYEGDRLLAAIPPWAHSTRFYGYSEEAIGEGPLAWGLDSATAITERFQEAEAYWQSWRQEPRPWSVIQQGEMAAYERVFEKERRYFAIDNKAWPPKALGWYERDGMVALCTIGVALRPQPQIELAMEDAQPHRRIELGILLRKPVDDQVIKAMASYLSGQSGLPWSSYTWLGHGHSIPCDELAPLGYAGVLLARSDTIGTHVALPNSYGDPVTLLWMVPITAKELQQAKAHGSKTVLANLTYPR